MTLDFRVTLRQLVAGQSLTRLEAEYLFQHMMNGDLTPAQMGATLTALAMKGETAEELIGAASALRTRATPFNVPANTIDTCGTGADGASTYNISTTCAFVVAACGVPVAKHGNRAVSSRSGSSDVLAALGVKVDAESHIMQQAIAECGVGFLMAPVYHPAMKHVAEVRKELGIRSIFNLIGPLCNPASVKRQLIGVFDKRWMRPFIEVAQALGTERLWVVHGEDGMDEITTTGLTHVLALEHGGVRQFTIDPRAFGMKLSRESDLRGGDAEENAHALREVLQGKPGAYRDIVLLNSAAALVVADKAHNLPEALKLATDAIDSGRAFAVLEQLITLTHTPS